MDWPPFLLRTGPEGEIRTEAHETSELRAEKTGPAQFEMFKKGFGLKTEWAGPDSCSELKNFQIKGCRHESGLRPG